MIDLSDYIRVRKCSILLFFRHVPKYLLPRGMQVADLNRRRKRKRNKSGTGNSRRTDNDPLQSFDGGDVNLEGVSGSDDAEMPVFTPEEEVNSKRQKRDEDGDKKIVTSAQDTGKSNAGRNAWKEKHKKGKFSGKKRKSERKIRQPLGI